MDSVVLLVFEKRRKAGFLAFANVFNFFLVGITCHTCLPLTAIDRSTYD